MEDKTEKTEKPALTKDELQLLITIISELSVPIKQSSKFIDLINKMSKMIDEL